MRLPGAAPKVDRSTAAPEDVVASADRAPVLARFEILTGFYGNGRKLTQTGLRALPTPNSLYRCSGPGPLR